MSPKGRPPADEDLRAGHRRKVGDDDALDLPDVDARIVHVAPPETLWPLAAEVWSDYVDELVALKLLHRTDLARLRELCVQTAIGIECEATLEEFGSMMKEPIVVYSKEAEADEIVGWKLKRNPAAKEHREATASARLVAAELGLTPLARLRGHLMEAQAASYVFGIGETIDGELDAEDAAAKVARKKPCNTKRGTK